MHLATETARLVGYALQTASARWRRRTLRRKGSPHTVVQTIKTTSGTIRLLVPLRDLSRTRKKYVAKGKPTRLSGLVNQPSAHIIAHDNGVRRGWYNSYPLAEQGGRLTYARDVLQYALAKTLAHKAGIPVAKVFHKYGKPLTVRKPHGRVVCFYQDALMQVKNAKTTTEVEAVPHWSPRRTPTRRWESGAICGSPERVERHHVRHLRTRGEAVRGFRLYLAAMNRNQVPVCHACHHDLHRGSDDGESLAAREDRLQAAPPVA